MKCVYVLLVHVGSNGIGDGLTCPHCLIIMKKKKYNKRQCDYCLCVMCWERFEGLLNHCWCYFMFMWLGTAQCYKNGHLLVICVNLSSALFWGIGCDKRYVHLEIISTKEDVPFRGKYRAPRWIQYFEGRIARRDGYYYRGSCRAPRQMHGLICPPWVPDWETAGVYH